MPAGHTRCEVDGFFGLIKQCNAHPMSIYIIQYVFVCDSSKDYYMEHLQTQGLWSRVQEVTSMG